MVDRLRQYGYLSDEPTEKQWIDMTKGQTLAGFGIGIITLDVAWYPMVPGNVENAWTYRYPVLFTQAKGLDTPTLHSGTPEAYGKVLEAAKELERQGCRAISGACGFFGHFQKQLAADMQIPVALSSLVQIPWIRMIIKPGSKIGILTANASAMDEKLFDHLGIPMGDDLVVADLRREKNFSAIMEDKGSFDNAGVRHEVVAAANNLCEKYPDIEAILLECSDMPPYAWAVQAAVKRPVFDFITMIDWLQRSVQQRPYAGWI